MGYYLFIQFIEKFFPIFQSPFFSTQERMDGVKSWRPLGILKPTFLHEGELKDERGGNENAKPKQNRFLDHTDPWNLLFLAWAPWVRLLPGEIPDEAHHLGRRVSRGRIRGHLRQAFCQCRQQGPRSTNCDREQARWRLIRSHGQLKKREA
jgi:hypothetical protein